MRSASVYVPALAALFIASTAAAQGTVASALSNLPEILKFGPIAVAAIMIVVAGSAMSLGVNQRRQQLVNRLMTVGVICFVVASAAAILEKQIGSASTAVNFEIFPHDLAGSLLPTPKIRIEGNTLQRPFKYRFEKDGTVVIDVSEAINTADAFKAQNLRQAEVMRTVAANADAAIAALNRSSDIAVGRICSGGSSGIPSSSGPEMASLNRSAAATLATAKSSIETVLANFVLEETKP